MPLLMKDNFFFLNVIPRSLLRGATPQFDSELGKRYWFDFDAIVSDGDHVHVLQAQLHGFRLQE